MSIRSIFKVSKKTFINPAGWVDYKNLKEQNSTLARILKTLFTPEQAALIETFAEAQQRLQLTDKDIQNLIMRYQLIAIFFLLLGILCLSYTIYLLRAHATYTGFILGIVSSGLLLSQALRYDFWVVQMKQRKLGLTLTDWKNARFGKKG